MFLSFNPFSAFKDYSKPQTRDTGRDLRHKDVVAGLLPSRNLEAGQGPPEAGGEPWSICELEPLEEVF